jgi:hypothetical protein
MELSFEIQGGQKLSRVFPVARAEIDDLTEPMKDSADLVLQTNEETFSREGPGWAHLARSTVLQRERLGYPGEHPILVRSGRLMRSLTQKGAEGNIYEYGTQHMRAGSVLKVPGGWNLAMLHQEGTDRMPARRILGLNIGNLRRNLSRTWEMWLYHIPAEIERRAARGGFYGEMESIMKYNIEVD